MTDIGELVVRIRADAAQLEREMKRANGVVSQNTQQMGSAFGRLQREILSLAPAVSAVALVEFGRRAVDAAGHVVDLADRIGFVSSTLSALESPLAASGAGLDEFSGAITRMNNLIGEAGKGNEQAVLSFDALGLSVDKLRTLSPEEQFYEIAGALGRIKDQATQTESGINIFGRSFAVLLPLLKQYEGDMRKAVEAQKELGNGLDKETLDRIDAFGDSLSNAGIRVKNVFLEALNAILKVNDAVSQAVGKPSANAKWNMPGENPLPEAYIKKAKSMGFVTEAKFVQRGTEQYGPAYQPPSAKGDNKDLLARIQAQKDALKATKEHADATDALKEKQKELDKAAQEAAHTQALFHDRLTRGLTDVVFGANSAKDAFKGLADQIARAAFERKVAQPLIDGLIGGSGTSGGGLLGSLLPSAGSLFGGFFADGGRPPTGKLSVVGERGPEIFVPDTAGTVIPNSKLGGTTVIVQQTIQLSPGVPELINARIREAAPVIAAQAQAATLQAMRQGGDASRIIGARG